MTRHLLTALALALSLAAAQDTAQAAASQAYMQCLQRAADFCQAETAHIKPPHRGKAYSQCYRVARRRCSGFNGPDRVRATPFARSFNRPGRMRAAPFQRGTTAPARPRSWRR